MKIKKYIAYIACVMMTVMCVQSAQADIKSLFQRGEDVAMGDSIKGKLITFNTEGELYTLESDSRALPAECRIVLQDDDTVWFENLFPIQTRSHYRKWLKGLYIKDAQFYDPKIQDYVREDIVAILPFIDIDYKEWTEGDNKYSSSFNLRGVQPGDLPYIEYDKKYNDSPDLAKYIRFSIADDMTLKSAGAIGEVRNLYTIEYNYNISNPYGILLNKLKRTKSYDINGAEAYIANLKLIPKQL